MGGGIRDLGVLFLHHHLQSKEAALTSQGKKPQPSPSEWVGRRPENLPAQRCPTEVRSIMGATCDCVCVCDSKFPGATFVEKIKKVQLGLIILFNPIYLSYHNLSRESTYIC